MRDWIRALELLDSFFFVPTSSAACIQSLWFRDILNNTTSGTTVGSLLLDKIPILGIVIFNSNSTRFTLHFNNENIM